MNIARTVKSALTKIEQQNQHLRSEQGTILDSAGKSIINKTGTSDRIKASLFELMKLQLRELKNKRDIFTHNHPVDEHLSLVDIKSAIGYRTREMRATTPNGKLYIMELPKKFSRKDSKRAVNFLNQLFHLQKPSLKELFKHPSFYIEKLEQYQAQHFITPTRQQRKLIERQISGVKFRTIPMEGQEIRPPESISKDMMKAVIADKLK